ncbi:MAG: hypothetical protein LBF32_01000 [Streptococcaceae bacterium]|nr:hypothetical protein [Streptococcaceae bacterium]
MFKLFKKSFLSVAILFCFLYPSLPVLAHQGSLNDAEDQQIGEVHFCNICPPNLEIPAEEGTLQGDTNWCLATCMNIVHRDILNKGNQLQPPFDNAGSIEDFARLGFISFPVQNGVVLPFQLVDQPQDVAAMKYMKIFTAHLNLPQDDEGLALECKAFHERLKYLSTEKRLEIWDGHDYFEPIPQRLKELIPLDVGSVAVIFNQMMDNPDFCQLKRAIFDGRTNPWEQIFQDIWDHERMVIVNMENTAGGEIGHSVIAYAAIQYADGRQVILIHNPDMGILSRILIDSPPVVDIGELSYQLLSYCIFNY